MTEGTIYEGFVPPIPWPPAENTTIMEAPLAGDYSAAVVARADGTVAFWVFEADGREVVSAVSVPIRFTGEGPTLFSFHWSAGRAGIRLGRRDVTALSGESHDLVSLALKYPELDQTPSFDHPDAVGACANKVAYRRACYSARSPRKPKTGERLKTMPEQLADIERSIVNVRSFSTALAAGDFNVLGNLATELRTLTRREGSNFDAALSRIADLAGIPMPVYCTPDVLGDPTVPAIIREAMRQSGMTHATTKMVRPDQRIADLEDWLGRPVYIGRPGVTKTVGDVFYDVANTMGAAHYSTNIFEYVDELARSMHLGGNELAVFFAQAGEVVAEVGAYVISESRRRGLV